MITVRERLQCYRNKPRMSARYFTMTVCRGGGGCAIEGRYKVTTLGGYIFCNLLHSKTSM